METWVIVLIVVAILALIAAFVLVPRMRNDAKKQEQAREHLQEAQVRSNRAEQQQASAQEQVAAARRERAEVEERAALAEREAEQKLANARSEQAQADSLHQRAEHLAPGVGSGDDGYDDRAAEPTYDDRANDGSTREGHIAHQPTTETTRRPDEPGTAPRV